MPEPARAAAPASDLAPSLARRFEVRRKLGAGAFGVVYEALDRKRRMPVALKVLGARDPAALYRFKAEFRAIADIAHPNLVALYELVAEDETWAFSMELARRRRGELAGDAGLRDAGTRFMRAEGVESPERLTAMLAPGLPGGGVRGFAAVPAVEWPASCGRSTSSPTGSGRVRRSSP